MSTVTEANKKTFFETYLELLYEFSKYISFSKKDIKRTLMFMASVLIDILLTLSYVYLSQFTWGVDEAIRYNLPYLLTASTHYIGAQLILVGSSFLRDFLLSLTSQSISQEARDKMLDSWLDKKHTHYFLRQQNDIFSTPTDSIITYTHEISSRSTNVAHSTLTIPVKFAYTLYQIAKISGTLPASVLGFAVPYYMLYPAIAYSITIQLVTYFLESWFKKRHAEWHDDMHSMKKHLVSIAENPLGVAASRSEHNENRIFKEKSNHLYNRLDGYYLVSHMKQSVQEYFLGMSLSLAAFTSYYELTSGNMVVSGFKFFRDQLSQLGSASVRQANIIHQVALSSKPLENIQKWREETGRIQKRLAKRDEDFKIEYNTDNKDSRIKIEIQNLTAEIPVRKPSFLTNANITLDGGNSYKMTGASGDGKSTFIKIINGLWLDVSSGKVNFGCKQDDICYIPQNPRSIEAGKTLKEIIEARAPKDSIDWKLVEQYMNDWGIGDKYKLLEDKKTKWAVTLSDGEKQRVALIPVLARKAEFLPKVIFLDEATCHFEAEIQQKVFNEIDQRIVNNSGILIYVGHNEPVWKCTNPVKHLSVKQGKLEISDDSSPPSPESNQSPNQIPSATPRTTPPASPGLSCR